MAGTLGAARDCAGDDLGACQARRRLFEGLLQAAPALAGGLTVATWVIWGLGSALLVLLGAGLHLLVAMWRRCGGEPGSR